MELVDYQNLFEKQFLRSPYLKGRPEGDYYYLKHTPSCKIEKGDKIFIHSLRGGYTKKEVKEHVEFCGAIIVSKIEESSKILINSRQDFEWQSFKELPVEINPLIARFSTRILFDTIISDLRKKRNSLREIQEFNTETYENIIRLISSQSIDDIKIACILIMSMDWTDNEFYLFFLFNRYADKIRMCVPSKIPNWSNWINSLQHLCLVASPGLWEFWNFMKKFTITEEQQQLIKKYL